MSALFNNYARRPIHIVRGSGTTVIDDTGKSYLDFTSGIAVLSLGHSHPVIVNAIQEQSEKLMHISNLFESPEQEQLAQSLIEGTHFAHAFFCNSGAEANEAAIKLARKHTSKSTIITFEQSFHGRTFGAMSATGQDKVKSGFGPLLQTFKTLPYNDSHALEEAVDDSVAAIMLEIIQGEGGVNEITPEFAATISCLCKEKGILLIVDEIQTGIGRTGTKYAYEQTILQPDILTLAKGLGGGFPIGAMIGTAKLYESFGPGSHGTTFGGNPLAMAVASATIGQVFNKQFLEDVKKKSVFLVSKLCEILPENQFELRGKGLLLGIKCKEEVASIIQQAEENGLLLVQAGSNVIRLLPPLTVTEEEMEQAVSILSSLVLTAQYK